MLSVVWQIRVLADSVWSSEACQMLPHQHLLYHLKRVILPTMTVIPPERATLTEAPSMGSTGSRLLRPASAAFWELGPSGATLSADVCTPPNLCLQLKKKEWRKGKKGRRIPLELCANLPKCVCVWTLLHRGQDDGNKKGDGGLTVTVAPRNVAIHLQVSRWRQVGKVTSSCVVADKWTPVNFWLCHSQVLVKKCCNVESIYYRPFFKDRSPSLKQCLKTVHQLSWNTAQDVLSPGCIVVLNIHLNGFNFWCRTSGLTFETAGCEKTRPAFWIRQEESFFSYTNTAVAQIPLV